MAAYQIGMFAVAFAVAMMAISGPTLEFSLTSPKRPQSRASQPEPKPEPTIDEVTSKQATGLPLTKDDNAYVLQKEADARGKANREPVDWEKQILEGGSADLVQKIKEISGDDEFVSDLEKRQEDLGTSQSSVVPPPPDIRGDDSKPQGVVEPKIPEPAEPIIPPVIGLTEKIPYMNIVPPAFRSRPAKMYESRQLGNILHTVPMSVGEVLGVFKDPLPADFFPTSHVIYFIQVIDTRPGSEVVNQTYCAQGLISCAGYGAHARPFYYNTTQQTSVKNRRRVYFDCSIVGKFTNERAYWNRALAVSEQPNTDQFDECVLWLVKNVPSFSKAENMPWVPALCGKDYLPNAQS